jgi:hypothetical protein
MLKVVRYKEVYKQAWDAFVASSKNGTFLFMRDYMEYHAHRFTDHSLLFFQRDKLIALLPANEVGIEIQSHGGLSYGGVISGMNMKAPVMLRVFDAMQLYMKEAGFNKLTYKAIPHIYHQVPAEEDLYALFRAGAVLSRRDLNSVIYIHNTLPYSQLRKRKLKRNSISSLEIKQSNEFARFMHLQTEVLQVKYNLKPTHTVDEIQELSARFPDEIKLFAAYEATEMLAGVIIYETPTVVHCQYIGTTNRGRLVSALDVLVHYLLTDVYAGRQHFSFGVSTEQIGRYLNENLVRNKESFGARSVVQDFYELHF